MTTMTRIIRTKDRSTSSGSWTMVNSLCTCLQRCPCKALSFSYQPSTSPEPIQQPASAEPYQSQSCLPEPICLEPVCPEPVCPECWWVFVSCHKGGRAYRLMHIPVFKKMLVKRSQNLENGFVGRPSVIEGCCSQEILDQL